MSILSVSRPPVQAPVSQALLDASAANIYSSQTTKPNHFLTCPHAQTWADFGGEMTTNTGCIPARDLGLLSQSKQQREIRLLWTGT